MNENHISPFLWMRGELFGAYGWDFGVRDMRYLLVPHAFSMAQYPDPDCPPHFYAGYAEEPGKI